MNAEKRTATLRSYAKQIRDGVRGLKNLERSLVTTLGLIETEIDAIQADLTRAGLDSLPTISVVDESRDSA